MDMDTAKLDVFLTSQTKKKEGGLTPEQAKVYAKFWKNHRTKIHKAMVTVLHVSFLEFYSLASCPCTPYENEHLLLNINNTCFK